MMYAIHESVSRQYSAEDVILGFLCPVSLALPLYCTGLRNVLNVLNKVEKGLVLFL